MANTQQLDFEKLYICNTAIIPQNVIGKLLVTKISENVAKRLIHAKVKQNRLVSAIGHKSTAAYLSKLFETEIKENRITIKLQPCESMIAFQFKSRLPKEAYKPDLDINEFKEIVEKIGYIFKLIEYYQ